MYESMYEKIIISMSKISLKFPTKILVNFVIFVKLFEFECSKIKQDLNYKKKTWK